MSAQNFCTGEPPIRKSQNHTTGMRRLFLSVRTSYWVHLPWPTLFLPLILHRQNNQVKVNRNGKCMICFALLRYAYQHLFIHRAIAAPREVPLMKEVPRTTNLKTSCQVSYLATTRVVYGALESGQQRILLITHHQHKGRK